MVSYSSLFSEDVAVSRGTACPFFWPIVHAVEDHPKVHFGKGMQVFLAIKLKTLIILVL